ncbi:MAG TPA: hypothetical protein VFP78_18620 [Solirubrobacteraceae bacterium]|nr:hypothetical protein [Solirubrobacteraceae bacterium]
MTTTVTILRDLWRLRLAVLAVFAVALLVGVAVAFRLPSLESRQDKIGVATVRVLVDTPTPQIVDIAPKGSETLGARTTLLASLMVDGVVKDSIARRAGLEPSELQSDTSVGTGEPPAERPDAGEYGLATRVILSGSGDPLPIIEVETQGPDAAAAGNLANAAVAGLRDYLDTQAAETPIARRLKVGGLAPAQAGTVVRGPGGGMAVIVTLVILAAGCALLLLVRAVARDWRVVPALSWSTMSDAGLDEPEPPHTNGASPTSHRDPFDEYWLTPEPVPSQEDGNGNGHGHGNGNGNGNGATADSRAGANLD